MSTLFDVDIIGAGAVGSAIARELARYDLKVILLEANADVGMGTSKASTAISCICRCSSWPRSCMPTFWLVHPASRIPG